MPDNKHNYEYNYDLGDVINNAVQMGSKIGSSVLGSIADALEQAGDAMGMKQPDTFAAWKRRLERKWKNGGQSVGVALTAVGWTFAGCFGIAAFVHGHPDGSRRRAAGAFPTGFYSPADSDGRVLPHNARLPLYGHRGHEKAGLFQPPAQAAARCQ